MGEGPVRDASGNLRDAGEVLSEAGIEPVTLREKEGLALINGTDGMLGMLVLASADLRELLVTADVTAAMSVEGLLGTDPVFAADLQELRPQRGQAESAANLRTLLADSEIVASHRGPEDPRVQDAYSLRCAPAGGRGRARHGRARRRGRVARAGARRRQPGDHAATAGSSRTATSTGRRWGTCSTSWRSSSPTWRACPSVAPTASSTSPAITGCRVPRRRPGVDSGHMIAQYTQAAIVSELKRLAAPASVDSIPSSAMQEDHVSMGWSAGRKLRRAIDGLTRVLAIEPLTAARGIQLRAPLTPAPATAAVIAALREVTPGPAADRFMAPEIEAAVEFVSAGRPRRAAESVIGGLA